MRTSRILATLLTAALAAFPAATLIAQSGAKGQVWETLLQAPLPEDTEPIISINSSFRNASGSERARLLLYHVSAKGA